MSTDQIRAMGLDTSKDADRINEARRRILALRGDAERIHHESRRMTTKPLNHKQLSEELAAAETGSVELDAVIFKLLLGGLFWPENETCFLDYGSHRKPKCFTTDEGAAFSLMDRILGDDWVWSLDRNYKAAPVTPNYNIMLTHLDNAMGDNIQTSGNTRALAICAAIVVAAGQGIKA